MHNILLWSNLFSDPRYSVNFNALNCLFKSFTILLDINISWVQVKERVYVFYVEKKQKKHR